MNALLNHEAAAMENLNDRVAWNALVDHHEEVLEVPHRVALRAVAAMRRKARREKIMDEARRYFTKDHPGRIPIATCIRSHLYDVEGWNATIVIVNGRKPPQLHRPAQGHHENSATVNYITVGALYLLRLATIWRASQGVYIQHKPSVLGDLFMR